MSEETPLTKGGWVLADHSKGPGKMSQNSIRGLNNVKNAGYDWVSISKILRGTPLGYHAHWLPRPRQRQDSFDPDWKHRPGDRIPTEMGNGIMYKKERFNVKAGVAYGATVVEWPSCTFVEEHPVLSAETRYRCILRDTIKWSEEDPEDESDADSDTDKPKHPKTLKPEKHFCLTSHLCVDSGDEEPEVDFSATYRPTTRQNRDVEIQCCCGLVLKSDNE